MGLQTLKVLLVNINYYDQGNSIMETRCTLFQVHNGQHINIRKFMNRTLNYINVNTIHASERKILVLDNEDFNCAAVQNYIDKGMNSPLEIYIDLHYLVDNGYLNSDNDQDSVILKAMERAPVNVLILNVIYFDKGVGEWETRCMLLNLHPAREVDIWDLLETAFSNFDINSIHATKRKLNIEDEEDFSCAVVQHILNQPKNSAMDIWVTLND
ncbi:unnamed protein product [Mucor hiemalis]